MLNKLKSLIGNSYKYKDVIFIVEDIKQNKDIYIVYTNKRTYTFFENEVDVFLSEISIITLMKKEVLTPKTDNKLIQPIKEDNLSVILLDTIHKIQSDKDYVNQANAICNVITQMINVKKLEIQIKNLKQ